MNVLVKLMGALEVASGKRALRIMRELERGFDYELGRFDAPEDRPDAHRLQETRPHGR